MNIQKLRDNRYLAKAPILEDEYIEKMANFYTSEAAVKIFPSLRSIPFEQWLYRQYFLRLERGGLHDQGRI